MADINEIMGNLQGRLTDLENQNESLKRDIKDAASQTETVRQALSKIDITGQLNTINDTLKNTINQSLIDIKNTILNQGGVGRGGAGGNGGQGGAGQIGPAGPSNTQTNQINQTVLKNLFNAFGFDILLNNGLGSLPDPLSKLGLTAKAGSQNVITQLLMAKTMGGGGGIGMLPGGGGGGLVPGMPSGGFLGGAGGITGSLPMISTLVAAIVPTLIELNNTQKALRESGAITGQGFGAGLGATFKGIAMGANPFDLLSMKFATEIVNTFRSAGFKDNLAYSLSDSFGGITKQIGEKLSEQILPTAQNIATTLQQEQVGIGSVQDQAKNLSTTFAAFTTIVEALDASAKNGRASVAELNTSFNLILDTASQLGTIDQSSMTKFSEFLGSLFGTDTSSGQLGLSGNAKQPGSVAQALIKGSPYLAGLSGIPAPLALLSQNTDAVTNQFRSLFKRLAVQMPESLKNEPNGSGYDTYAAFLLAGFLPAIGMGNLSVATVSALLKAEGGGGSVPSNTLSSSQESFLGQEKGITGRAKTISNMIANKSYLSVANNMGQDNIEAMTKAISSDSSVTTALNSIGLSASDLIKYITTGTDVAAGGKSKLQNYLTSTALSKLLKSQKQKLGVNQGAIDLSTSISDALTSSNSDYSSTDLGNGITLVVQNTFTGAGIKELITQMQTEINTKPQG